MKKSVSVIVPSFNRGSLMRQCLAGILSQNHPFDLEVIVVDDGSTDNTCQVVEEYNNVRLISQENAGPGMARNHGVKEAHGEIVVFIDDDCIPEPVWLEHLLEPFDDPEIAGAKGAYLSRQTEIVARFVQLEYEQKYDQLSRHRFIDFIDTYSAAFRKQVFVEAGGYDSSFSTASVEDQDFSFRLANAGHKMVFIPGARVWHRHVDSIAAYFRKKLKIGFWKIRVLSKNPNKVTGDSHTPSSLKLQILLIIMMPLGLAGFAFPPWGIAAGLGIVGGFLVSTVPLSVRCARTDPVVALCAPFLIACRAVALSCGLAHGILRKILGDKRFSTSAVRTCT